MTPVVARSRCAHDLEGLSTLIAVVPVLALRIGDEEEMLANELDGYANYRTKVRSRLIPGVW